MTRASSLPRRHVPFGTAPPSVLQLLAMLEERTFGAKEFFETRQGVCRLMPPLTQVLAEMSPKLAKLAAPVVEQVAQRLTKGQGTAARSLTVPTLLTRSNRSAGRDIVRAVPKQIPVKRLAEETGLAVSTVKAARNGHTNPHSRNRHVLTGAAAAFGRERLRQLGIPSPSDDLACCAAFLAEVRA